MTRFYRDPTEEIWLTTAARLGMHIVRTDAVYASWDGRQTLSLSTPEGFDPDDCLAQLILHEICHALVEGPSAWTLPDWGLENIDDRHLVREHACHRLQAALTDLYGLRRVLSPTTDHRTYYAALPPDPLADGDDPAIPPAQSGWKRALHGPWAGPLHQALQATAGLALTLQAFAPHSLWSQLDLRPPCQQCRWLDEDSRCRLYGLERKAPVPGCPRWRPQLTTEDCARCGACCHRGFDVVDVEADSPLLHSHPHWMIDHGWGPQLPRPGGRCVALREEEPGPIWRCTVYAQRPRGCRDLQIGGDACLTARHRAGIERLQPAYEPEGAGGGGRELRRRS